MPHMPSLVLTLSALWLMFFVYSIFGWVIESTYCSIPAKHFINRGFLNGPYIPIYGSGAMIAIMFLAGLSSPLAVFLAGGALSCVLEYATSYVMEKIYHARWWDYSDMPFNLNGRIWAGGFVEFGVCMTLVVFVVNPPIVDVVDGLDHDVLYLASSFTFTVFMCDLAVTHFGITGLRARMDELKAETVTRLESLRELVPSRPELVGVSDWDGVLFSSLREHMANAREKIQEAAPSVSLPSLSGARLPKIAAFEEFAESFSHRLSFQERRIMQAFPKMRPTEYRSYLDGFSKRWREASDELKKLAETAKGNAERIEQKL